MTRIIRDIIADIEAIDRIKTMIENDEDIEKRADDIYSLLTDYEELLRNIKVNI